MNQRPLTENPIFQFLAAPAGESLGTPLMPTRQQIREYVDDMLGRVRGETAQGAESFGAYLMEIGVLNANPVRDVRAPPQARHKPVELELADVKRIVDGAMPPYRALFALLYGAGIEISAALACVESDVNATRREIRARGTKAHTRDRIVRIADWAWPYVEKHVDTLTPSERLFRGLDRWLVGDEHRSRLKALGLPHHRVHDARHFYAIQPFGPARRTNSSRANSGTPTCRWSRGLRALRVDER